MAAIDRRPRPPRRRVLPRKPPPRPEAGISALGQGTKSQPAEAGGLLAVASSLKVRVLLSYGCGLRAGEVVRLIIWRRRMFTAASPTNG